MLIFCKLRVSEVVENPATPPTTGSQTLDDAAEDVATVPCLEDRDDTDTRNRPCTDSLSSLEKHPVYKIAHRALLPGLSWTVAEMRPYCPESVETAGYLHAKAPLIKCSKMIPLSIKIPFYTVYRVY